LAFAERGVLGSELRRPFGQLLPERGDAGASILELERTLADRVLAPALALGERLPGAIELVLLVWHELQFALAPNLPFSRVRGQTPDGAVTDATATMEPRRGAGAVERTGLENRRPPNGRPWVQIPPPPLLL